MNTGSERKVLDKKSAVQSMFSKSVDNTNTFKTKLEVSTSNAVFGS